MLDHGTLRLMGASRHNAIRAPVELVLPLSMISPLALTRCGNSDISELLCETVVRGHGGLLWSR